VRRGSRLLPIIFVLQVVLLLVGYLLYKTWTFSPSTGGVAAPGWLQLVIVLLSLAFVPASVLALRYTNVLVRVFYKIAAVWVGLLSFCSIAMASSWIVFGVARLAGFNPDFHAIAEVFFALAGAAVILGVFNASWTRTTRITVQLEDLPDAWRGRKAALISDLHLGPVRNGSFMRRMVRKILGEEPHAIFIAGDLYDGTAIDAAKAAEPLRELAAPHGVYFVAGNHDQFRDDGKYLEAVARAGVRVLDNEKIEVEGLQIVGVPYRNASHPKTFASVLCGLGVDRGRPSILLTHAPDHPQIAEAAGISLQLSGHTHLGQFIPWSWIARRVYRQFVYGLSRIGNMQVFTSSGAGTWGPPLRLGSNPEIVVLQFE